MRARHSEEHGNDNERWLVSYADFITLMFAFFAVLYATSQKDTEKAKEFQESIKKYLIKAGVAGTGAAGNPAQLNDAVKYNSPIESPIPTYNDAKPDTARVLDQVEVFIESHLSKEERKKYILDLAADEWGVRIVVPSGQVFARESDKFNPEALAFVNKLSDLIRQTRRKILIEGHVAENETGPFKSTWDFASVRSLNLLRYMQKTQKLASTQLASASLADSKPLFKGERAADNSRMEIILLNSDYEF